eukprot:SAG11_NODE_847_length_6882_cov_3.352204_5_plen_148_part_00
MDYFVPSTEVICCRALIVMDSCGEEGEPNIGDTLTEPPSITNPFNPFSPPALSSPSRRVGAGVAKLPGLPLSGACASCCSGAAVSVMAGGGEATAGSDWRWAATGSGLCGAATGSGLRWNSRIERCRVSVLAPTCTVVHTKIVKSSR